MTESDEVETGGETRRGPDVTALQTITQRLADGILIVTGNGRVRFANPAAERLFGRSATELAEEEFGYPLLVGDRTEIDIVRRGGEVIVAELGTARVDWKGEDAFLVSLRDITDRRRAEERSRQLQEERAARAEAEASSRAKTEFLATMSHELRTPLNAILGYVQLMELGVPGPLNEQQRGQLERVRTSGQHLLQLVNEVLDVSKVESGGLALSCAPGDAGVVARGAVALVQPQCAEHAVELSVAEGLDDHVRYLGDEDRVRQILVNLLSNACKFTPEGGTIRLMWGRSTTPDGQARLPRGPEWVFVRVEDSGIGIPGDKLPTIFEPFVQVEGGRTRRRDGTGLGLTISRRLARLMDGDLTAQSIPGDGSVFTLWLPAADDGDRADRQVVEREAPEPDDTADLAGLGDDLMRQINVVLEAFVGRLRAELPEERTEPLTFAQLTDHSAALLADIATSLILLDEAREGRDARLTDSTEIQRLVAERHGVQRASLGWTPEDLRKEYELLRAEVRRVVARVRPRRSASANDGISPALDRFLDQSAFVAGRALSRAARQGSEGSA